MRKFIVNVNGNSYSVEVEEVSSDGQVSIPVAPVQVAAPVAQPAAKPSGNGTPLTTPMPGMVMRYNVKNGDKVKKGQCVLILEAMKMENEIAACCDGTINFVAQTGSSVETGDVLAYIS